jgi:hypothetical protein
MSQSDVPISLRDACYVDFNPAEWSVPDLSMSETIPSGIGGGNPKKPVRWNEEAMSHFKRDRDLRPEGGNWVFHFENDRMYFYSDLSGDWRYIMPFFRDDRGYFTDQVIVNRNPQQILPKFHTYGDSLEPIHLLLQLLPFRFNGETGKRAVIRRVARNSPMPDENRTIPMELVYSAQDWEVIKAGTSSTGEMEQYYEIEFADGKLHFYRTSSNRCHFIVQAEESSDGVRLTEATINCDPEQMLDGSDELWRGEIRLIIDHALLRKPGDFEMEMEILWTSCEG